MKTAIILGLIVVVLAFGGFVGAFASATISHAVTAHHTTLEGI